MPITTLSSREFNQEVARAKRCAQQGPVYITDRGTTTHVLLNVEEYRRIAGKPITLAELLSCPEAAEIDFDLPSREVQQFRDVDFE